MEPAAGGPVSGHALFNLWLAIGGGVAVPAGVGLFAFWSVHRQERAWANEFRQATASDALTSANVRSVDVEPDISRQSIAA